MDGLDAGSLNDVMPMLPEVYFRLFVRQNAALWPLHVLAPVLGIAALWLTYCGRRRVAATVLAACWIWVGVTFHLGLYAEVNWAAVYTCWAFVAQGVLLAGFGWARRLGGDPLMPLSGVHYTGFGLGFFALVVYPFMAPLTGRSWAGVELFGIAPDPTAMVTLGCLLLLQRIPPALAVIPVIWCGISGLTWYAMGWHPGLTVPAAALLFVIAATGEMRRRRRNQ